MALGWPLDRVVVIYSDLGQSGASAADREGFQRLVTEVSLGSSAMSADSRQADFCTYLSAILLGGLLLNALFGWWWADPVAGLAMVPIIVKEGADGLRGKACCDECGCD